MIAPNFTKPTESELDILKILWAKKTASVREVFEELRKSKDTVYTTTLKLMQIMNEKGLVSRDERAKTHYYTAIIEQKDARKKMISRMVDTLFQGSEKDFVMHVLGSFKGSGKELQEIQELMGLELKHK